MSIPEQLVPQIAQLEAELEICKAHGNKDRVAALQRQLAVIRDQYADPEPVVEAKPAKREANSAPQGRSTPQAQQSKAAK